MTNEGTKKKKKGSYKICFALLKEIKFSVIVLTALGKFDFVSQIDR